MNLRQKISMLLLAMLCTGTPASGKQPVKVYVLIGEGNMAGMGKLMGTGQRWGNEFTDVEVSVYGGDFYPGKDYSREQPLKRMKPKNFGGVEPDPFPGGGLQIVRGKINVAQDGLYQMRPGWMESTYNLMTVNGMEVHCRFPGGQSVWNPVRLKAGEPADFEIAYFKENGSGLGWMARLDEPGALSKAVIEQGMFPYLMKNDRWVERDDVWCRDVLSAKSNGWLSAGFGSEFGKFIGPELGFGHAVAEYHDEPVLLLKVARSGISLGWDLLPPGSQRHTMNGTVYAGFMDQQPSWKDGSSPQSGKQHAGWQYLDGVDRVRKVLADFDREFPEFNGLGYEIAGFVWWQGYRDSENKAYADRYEQNLQQLIQMVRQDFGVPDAPFVVGTVGQDGWKMKQPGLLKVAQAQLAVDGDSGKYPEFNGNVKSVETRGFWIDDKDAPGNLRSAYNQNAETFMKAGLAFGDAMLELIQNKK